MEKIILPAKTEYLYQFFDFLKKVIKGAGLEASLRISKLELATEEIFVNIANYAYEGQLGNVEIQCSIKANQFLICFVDQGIPFDMTKVSKPDISGTAAERLVGGLGIYLVKETMDYIHYEYKDGNNILVLGMNII